MKIVKCPKCGFDITLNESEPVAICDQCGAKFRNPIYVEPKIEEPVQETVVESPIQEPVQEQIQNDFSTTNDIFDPVQEEVVAKPEKQKKQPKPTKDKTNNSGKKPLLIVLVSIVCVVLVAAFIMSSLAVSKVSGEVKLDSIAKQLADLDYDEIYYYGDYQYDSEFDGAIIGYLHGYKNDTSFSSNGRNVSVYVLDSIKTAKKFKEYKNNELQERINDYNNNYYSSYDNPYYNYYVVRKGKVVYYGNSVYDAQ